ncbi:MAG: reprolysin-like metallopeptidase [Saprospiraceae bacterium]
MKQLYVLLFSIILTTAATAQSSYWSNAEEAAITVKGTRQIIPNKYQVVKLDVANFKNHINTAPLEYNSTSSKLTIELPMPDGSTEQFAIVESPLMEAGLSAKFPVIKSYLGQGITNSRAAVRFGWTYKGFHAMIISEKGQTFIDPYSSNEREYYISYHKKDFSSSKQFNCHTEADDDIVTFNHDDTPLNGNPENSGDQLRTYRLALACTGEYAQFHGGTVSGALSAMAVTMTRVNLIYETEVSIRMIMIANNNQLIFLNSGSDPYTNNDGGTMLGQNRNTVNSIIGSANYDIGHVFSTGGGGIASLRSPCGTRKAQGVTGQSSPVGDPFDVDYVAHEMGHQYGGNHTFNGTTGSCAGNLASQSSYEPGSATTIMGYAGICSGQNIQSNSDAFFHTHNFDEIVNFSVNGGGNSCASITNTGNNKPNVTAGTGGYFIPKSTPFELTGTANDPNGDPLTYSWEQFDLGPRGEPNTPTGNAPLFRSFEPKTIPSRTFPQISDIVNNTQTMGEILPDYSRGLSFRLTARDNKAGGGGVSYDGMSFEVTDAAGPFLVTQPNTSSVVWTEGTPATVNWDVANTNAAPVNCATVDILLSIDGGYTYPIVLATSVPNNGSISFVLPQGTATNNARIRVQCATNVFFDISNQNFTIVAPTAPAYFLYSVVDAQEFCAPNSAVFSIDVLSLLNYSDPVNISADGIPNGITLAFNSNPVTPGSTLEITATADESVATGTYPIEIKASSTSGDESIFINLSVFSSTPTVVAPLSPEDGTIGASNKLTWNNANGAPHTYHLQVSNEPTFANLLVDEDGLTDNFYVVPNLQGYSVYYWRVKANNQCSQGEFSEIFTFRTATLDCTTYGSGTSRIILSPIAFTYPSTLTITDDETIVDINVKNLQGTHSRISDLSFKLESPAGTEVELFSRICGNQNNFNINLDDEATNDNYPCPPTNGGTYQPQSPLGTFNGESSAGTWRLLVQDHEAGEGGKLDNWELEICKDVPNTNADPIVIKNDTLKATKGSNRNIPNELLLSTDADNGASDLVYTLIEATSEGTLQLNGTALSVGNTFTQSEINAGLLSYKHDEAAGISDAFRFHVEDGQGGWAGSPSFIIDIVEDINRFDLEAGEVRIYPNPTTDLLNISLRLATTEQVSFTVYDAIGQLVMEGALINAIAGTNDLQLNTNQLVNGVYALVIEGETFNITEKIVVSRK